jgi:hypothetical protein
VIVLFLIGAGTSPSAKGEDQNDVSRKIGATYLGLIKVLRFPEHRSYRAKGGKRAARSPPNEIYLSISGRLTP